MRGAGRPDELPSPALTRSGGASHAEPGQPGVAGGESPSPSPAQGRSREPLARLHALRSCSVPPPLPAAQFGRTEVIDNTLNPDFVRKFVLDYFFEEKQNLRFDV